LEKTTMKAFAPVALVLASAASLSLSACSPDQSTDASTAQSAPIAIDPGLPVVKPLTSCSLKVDSPSIDAVYHGQYFVGVVDPSALSGQGNVPPPPGGLSTPLLPGQTRATIDHAALGSDILDAHYDLRCTLSQPLQVFQQPDFELAVQWTCLEESQDAAKFQVRLIRAFPKNGQPAFDYVEQKVLQNGTSKLLGTGRCN
jgi:hypothetical protein